MEQGELGLATYRLMDTVNTDRSNLPTISSSWSEPQISDLHNVKQPMSDLPEPAKPDQSDLHNDIVNPNKLGLQTSVKQQNVGLDSYVNPGRTDLHKAKLEESGKNVNELDSLIQKIKHENISKYSRKKAFEPIVASTELLLDDHHSTAMFYKVLGALYPERLDLYVAAVRIALRAAEEDPTVNSGAVFVRTIRDFAEVAGVELGLKSSSSRLATGDSSADDLPGTQLPMAVMQSTAPPSVDEAVWSETQLVLRRQMTRATFDAIIQGTRLLGRADDIFVVGVQSKMAQEWLENRLRDVVQRALSNVVGTAVKVEFRVVDGLS